MLAVYGQVAYPFLPDGGIPVITGQAITGFSGFIKGVGIRP